MTQQVPFYIVLIVLAAVGAAWLIYRVAVAAKALTGALAENSAAIKALKDAAGPAIEDMRANMAGVPKLLEAVARIGQMQVAIAEKQRSAEEERARNPFGRTNGPVPARDVAAANLEDEVSQMMRAEGISREEAQMRLNPANMGSVWGNDQFFTGWR